MHSGRRTNSVEVELFCNCSCEKCDLGGCTECEDCEVGQKIAEIEDSVWDYFEDR
jgi:hypothetical protein